MLTGVNSPPGGTTVKWWTLEKRRLLGLQTHDSPSPILEAEPSLTCLPSWATAFPERPGQRVSCMSSEPTDSLPGQQGQRSSCLRGHWAPVKRKPPAESHVPPAESHVPPADLWGTAHQEGRRAGQRASPSGQGQLFPFYSSLLRARQTSAILRLWPETHGHCPCLLAWVVALGWAAAAPLVSPPPQHTPAWSQVSGLGPCRVQGLPQPPAQDRHTAPGPVHSTPWVVPTCALSVSTMATP